MKETASWVIPVGAPIGNEGTCLLLRNSNTICFCKRETRSLAVGVHLWVRQTELKRALFSWASGLQGNRSLIRFLPSFCTAVNCSECIISESSQYKASALTWEWGGGDNWIFRSCPLTFLDKEALWACLDSVWWLTIITLTSPGGEGCHIHTLRVPQLDLELRRETETHVFWKAQGTPLLVLRKECGL